MHERSLSLAATTAAIRAMPAGLEMDVAIAKALGYEIDVQALGVPCYSTDHGRAMEALHQFCKRHRMTCRVSYDGLEDDGPWSTDHGRAMEALHQFCQRHQMLEDGGPWWVSIFTAKRREHWTITASPGLPGLALACCRAILLAAAAAKEKS